MNLEGSKGIVAVGFAIVALVGVLFFLYRTTMGGPAQRISPDNAPDYAKQSGRTDTGGAPNGPRAPYGPGSAR
jgi:hypothetical protein